MRVDFTTANARRVQFDLEHDPSCVADLNTKAFAGMTGGMCEPATAQAMAHILREGDFALDVGANIGFFSVLMSRLVGNAGRIYAFEPGVNNVSRLRANLACSVCENVRVLEQPLWRKAEQVRLHLFLDGGRNSLAPDAESRSSMCLPALTLDIFLRDVRSPRLIKLDVEGAEQAILEGGVGAVDPEKVPFILCELHEAALQKFGYSQKSLRQVATSLGYQTFRISEDGSRSLLVPDDHALRPQNTNYVVLFSTPNAVFEAWS